MKLSFILTSISFFCGLQISAQNYFITAAQDSVPCSQINFFNTNAQGKMIQLEYVDAANKTILLKNQDIPDILRLAQDGVLYIKMPMKLAKPDGYYRYGKRVVSGSIIVDVFDDVQTSYRLKENFDGSYNAQGVMKSTTEGVYMRHVYLPTGVVYEVAGLGGLKAIKPIREFMFKCEPYKTEYFANPKYQTCTFEEAVADYNIICKDEK
jgi:hypothetical protein